MVDLHEPDLVVDQIVVDLVGRHLDGQAVRGLADDDSLAGGQNAGVDITVGVGGLILQHADRDGGFRLDRAVGVQLSGRRDDLVDRGVVPVAVLEIIAQRFLHVVGLRFGGDRDEDRRIDRIVRHERELEVDLAEVDEALFIGGRNSGDLAVIAVLVDHDHLGDIGAGLIRVEREHRALQRLGIRLDLAVFGDLAVLVEAERDRFGLMRVGDRDRPVAVRDVSGIGIDDGLLELGLGVLHSVAGFKDVGIRDRRFGEAVLDICSLLARLESRQIREAPLKVAICVGRDGNRVSDRIAVAVHRDCYVISQERDLDALRTDHILIVRIVPNLQTVDVHQLGNMRVGDLDEPVAVLIYGRGVHNRVA